jgi:tRNA dimethylallyltransferase
MSDKCTGDPGDTPPDLLFTSIALKSGDSGDLVVAVVGPTGSGKSDLALFLAEHFGGEIINCDSIQVYAGLNIGSAKTRPEERRGIPHHLLDIVQVTRELSAGEYARLARPVIRSVIERGKLPIVAGGTGFYLRALFDGLSPAPARCPALRARLDRVWRRRPVALQRYLRRFDPIAAARIHTNDRQKLIRAIEMTRLLRQPASAVQSQPRDSFGGIRLLILGLDPDRRLLYERLDRRAEWMFANGLLSESEHMLSQFRDVGIPRALCSVGYREAIQHLRGELTFGEALQQAKVRTRHYAKRQMTWFRADSRVQWISGFGFEADVQSTALSRVNACKA